MLDYINILAAGLPYAALLLTSAMLVEVAA